MSANGIIHYEKDDMTYVGVYTTSDGMVHVSNLGAFPTKSTQIGGSSPESLAHVMLGEFGNRQLEERAQVRKLSFS
jgi:hypothetical protein